MGNCHPSKTTVNLGFASVDIGFLGVINFRYLPSRAVNIYIILNRHLHCLNYVWFQNNPGQVNYVLQIFKGSYIASQNLW